MPRDKKQRHAEQKHKPAPSPNHFLALQVSQHPAVCAAISQVHASITAHSPHLRKACVDAGSAHLTLGVLALNSEGERAQAAAALAELAAPLAQAALLAPVEVQVESLSTFQDQVLYLDLRKDEGLERLLRLAAATRAHFQAAGLLLQTEQAFVPHITVAKTSKLKGGRGGGGGGGGRHGGHGRGRGRGRGQGRSARDWREEREAIQAWLGREVETDQQLALMGRPAGPSSGATLPMAAAAGGNLATEPSSAAAAAAAAAFADPFSKLPSSSSAAAQDAAAGDAQRQQQQGLQAKGSQPQLDWRQIPADAWAAHAHISGGTAVLAEVQLCAMQGRKEGHYYTVLCSLPLEPGNLDGGSGAAGQEAQAMGGAAGSRAVQREQAGDAVGAKMTQPDKQTVDQKLYSGG